MLGGEAADLIPSTAGVILYAEPETAIDSVMNTALLWHVPFGVLMAVLSLVTLRYTCNVV